MTRNADPRPPRVWALLARLLIRGRDGAHIRGDLDESYARDRARGVAHRRAARRYAANVLGSTWSVWRGGARGLLTRGALMDAKVGLRMLGKQPMLTGVALLALGLGIPSALTMHHVLNALFTPLPVPEGHRLMGVRHWDAARNRATMASVHDFDRWQGALSSFEGLGAARSYTVNVYAGDASAPPVRAAEITAGVFGLLRSQPLLGRVFAARDEVRGAPDVVLLGEDLWASRFAADPDIVGRTVRIGRATHTVVGVMPSDFRFPMGDDLWLPLRARPADYPEGEGPDLWVFGRLADGVDRTAADLEFEVVTARAADDDPARYEHLRPQVVDMPTLLMGEMEFLQSNPEVLMVQSLILALLLIVCGNVGLLILARTANRTAELSIRTALGASRARIVGQIFVEALVLALVATGLGLVGAEWVAHQVSNLMAPYDVLPYWMDVTLTADIVLAALGLAVVSAVVAGVVPALRATGRGISANLQRAAAGNASLRFGVGSTLLIVTEVALSVGFLALGGALIRSGFLGTEGELGFDPDRFASVSVRLPWLDPASYPESADDADFHARLADVHRTVLERVASADGVVAVGMATDVPGNDGTDRYVVLESLAGADDPPTHLVIVHGVDVGFFGGLDRPILAGRDFTAADAEGPPGRHRSPVLVNTTFVDQVLQGRNAVGQRFRYQRQGAPPPEDPEWFEIVGVVGRFGTNPVNPARDATFYTPLRAGDANPMRYLVRVAGAPSDFLPRFREIVASVDPEATARGGSLAEVLTTEARFYRWIFIMQLLLAAVAFLLSVTGLYALMSFTVAQRTREIGIRTALGARAVSIVATIARRAALQLAVGLALGGALAWYLLDNMGGDPIVRPVNIPLLVALTVTGAALVGMAGCASPTLRGLRIQPTEALREKG